MTPEQLAAIKARHAKATTGDGLRNGRCWMARELGNFGNRYQVCTRDLRHVVFADSWDDANFVANAHADIPALVAEVERLRKPCPVCEAAHALTLSGNQSDAEGLIKAAFVTERKLKEKAEAEAATLRAELDAAKAEAKDATGCFMSLLDDAKRLRSDLSSARAALKSEMEISAKYRNEPHRPERDCPGCAPCEGDEKCEICREYDALRAAGSGE